MIYSADFETTTNDEDCRVWAWGVCDVDNPEQFYYGNTIDTFFNFMEKSKNSTFYFHNLKFDGEFILYYLFKNGFKFVEDRKFLKSKTFTTLISDKGQFYSIKIYFKKTEKNSNCVTIYDSLKVLPFSVSQIAKGFNLPISKLEIDYKKDRPIGYELEEKEIEYLKNDVEIVARALSSLFAQGLTKMTQASNAMHNYKEIVTEKAFKRWFPPPDYDHDIRQAYKGGFTYLNKKYKNVDIGTGLVFDVNSLYPSVMHDCPLPYGQGIFFRGQYEEDKLYNLYIQMFTCQFKLKEGYIPTIQLKNNLMFIPTQYLESSNDEEVTMCLSSVDLELFFEHYEVYNIVYHSGWKFKSTIGLFTAYIDKWNAEKIKAGKEKNKALRTIAKLMLNALYGRFAINPNVQSKYPYLEDDIIKYKLGEKETREPVYLPVGIFITAWARYKTITTAQKVYDIFVYADTDSLHLKLDLPKEIIEMNNEDLEKLTTKDLIKLGVPIPEDFEIDPYKLGAWKLESKFNRARFIRQKCYCEDWNNPNTWDKEEFSTKEVKERCEKNNLDFDEEIKKYAGMYDKDLLNITCAGMPEKCYQYANWNNFKEGNTFAGKLQPKHVQGGIILKDIEFTIVKGL